MLKLCMRPMCVELVVLSAVVQLEVGEYSCCTLLLTCFFLKDHTDSMQI